MKSTLLLSALALISAAPARADLGIEYKNQSTAVIFHDGDHVYFESCGAHVVHPHRGCSGKDLGQIYSAELERYVRSVQSFYSLLDRDYGGPRGGATLDAKIANLKEHLDHDDLTVEELRRAETLLRELVTLKDHSDKADREVLRYLETGEDVTFSEEFQGERTSIAQLSFYGVAYLTDEKLLYRVSDPSSFAGQSAACTSFGSGWYAIGSTGALGASLRQRLTLSALVPEGQTVQVWTSDATGAGRYKVTCGWCCDYSHPQTKYDSKYYDPAEYRRESESASYYGGICKYTNGCATGEESIDYEPRLGTVASFGADNGDQQVPIESSEGVDSGTVHSALCARSFQMAHDDDHGYLNEPHFTSFSLGELDNSFERLAHSVYPNRATFFRELAKALADYPVRPGENPRSANGNAGARLFALEAISPILHDIQSRFVELYVLPDYLRAKEEWGKRLGAETLLAIPLGTEVYRIAALCLRGAIDASKTYLSTEDKRQGEELMLAIGEALATGPSGRPALVNQLKSHRETIQRIAGSPRTAGFGVMALAIQDYLEKK